MCAGIHFGVNYIFRYFGHRLFLWLPLRLCRMALTCPFCKVTHLTKQGLYRLTRIVLDIDSFYILATESLHCVKCKKNQIGWSEAILDQLDPATRSTFPVQMMYHSACDTRVIYLLRQRGLGNHDFVKLKMCIYLPQMKFTIQLI